MSIMLYDATLRSLLTEKTSARAVSQLTTSAWRPSDDGNCYVLTGVAEEAAEEIGNDSGCSKEEQKEQRHRMPVWEISFHISSEICQYSSVRKPPK